MDGVSSSIVVMGLDLNEEPMIPPSNSSSDSVEVVNHHSPSDLQWETNMPIERRIQCIQHLNTHTSTSFPRWAQGGPSGTSTANYGNISADNEDGKCYSSNCADLVAKALEKEMLDLKKEVKKIEKKVGSYYDCKICFEVAKEPVLTCCGHLFCWNCFYNIPYIDSCTKECPECDGEVSDSTVIPIYGNGGGKNDSNEDQTSLKMPPRPKARRVESVRPVLPVFLSHIPVVDALRRIRISFGNGPDPSSQTTAQIGVLTADMEARSLRTANRVRTRRRMLRQRASSTSNANPSSTLGISDGSDANVLSLESNYVVRNLADTIGVMALPVITTSSSQPSDVSGHVTNGTSPSPAPSYPYNLRSRSRRASATSNSDMGSRDSNNASRRRRLN